MIRFAHIAIFVWEVQVSKPVRGNVTSSDVMHDGLPSILF